MTWDVYAIRAPAHVRRLEDLSDRHSPRIIGTADAVTDAIRAAVPDVDTTDPTWLRLDRPDHSVEIAVGKGAQVHSITFYLGGGDRAVPVVLDLCRRLAVTPFDTETGEVLTATSVPPAGPPPDDDADRSGKRRWWRRAGGG